MRQCPACGDSLIPNSDVAVWPLVYSDCSAWSGPFAQFAECRCGFIGKVPTDAYMTAIESGYEAYAPHHQGTRSDQPIFVNGAPHARCDRIVEWLRALDLAPSTGSVLDFGCGSGSMLHAWARIGHSGPMDGCDIGDDQAELVLRIPGVRHFINLSRDWPTGKYQVISLIHVVEHLLDLAVLSRLADSLGDGGVLVIQVPYVSRNPYDLGIGDHVNHFTPHTLRRTLERLGLQVWHESVDIVQREISIVAAARMSPQDAPDYQIKPDEERDLAALVSSLDGVVSRISSVDSSDRPVAIFGSSISASWTYSVCQHLGITVDRLVDEDADRWGRELRGLPIVGPHDATIRSDGTVLVPQMGDSATSIAGRLQSVGANPYLLREPTASVEPLL